MSKVKKSRTTNPVAKFARRVNRASVHRDKKNDYHRKAKHNKKLDS